MHIYQALLEYEDLEGNAVYVVAILPAQSHTQAKTAVRASVASTLQKGMAPESLTLISVEHVCSVKSFLASSGPIELVHI